MVPHPLWSRSYESRIVQQSSQEELRTSPGTPSACTFLCSWTALCMRNFIFCVSELLYLCISSVFLTQTLLKEPIPLETGMPFAHTSSAPQPSCPATSQCLHLYFLAFCLLVSQRMGETMNLAQPQSLTFFEAEHQKQPYREQNQFW